MRVLLLSHRDVLAALTPQACAEAMAAVLTQRARGETYMPLRSVMAPPEASGFMGLMPGWRGPQGGNAASFALKAVCIMPGNPARGLDAHQGLVTLFDAESGQPTAILDASAITEIRTAAVTAVATGVLARRDARTLAILGAGTQARAHLLALAASTRIRAGARLRAHRGARPRADRPGRRHPRRADRRRQRAGGAPRRRRRRHRDELPRAGAPARLAEARRPRQRGRRQQPAAREIDTATVAASALFCDSRESLRNEAGEFRLAIADGLIAGEEHVRAELGEVLAGTAPGRREASELTLFRSLGLAVEDLAAAECAVAAATARGLGTEVEL